MEHKIYERNGTSVLIPTAHSYKDVAILIKSDYFRSVGHVSSIFKIWFKTLLWGGGTSVLFWFRMSQYRKGALYYLSEVMRKHYCTKYQIQLSSHTRIGYGLTIPHGIACVINPSTIIGNNVQLSHYVNIGSTVDKSALIGDCVSFSPMVCIINDVTIGKNVTIGAGAIVTKDIPKNATIVGNPAKVINYDKPAHYIGNKWPIPDDDGFEKIEV